VNRHQLALARRREELVERSVAQRAALIAAVAPLADKAATLDRILGTLRRYSVVAGIIAAVAALFGSRGVLDIGSRLLSLYLLARRR
jgi:hypothetical protein